MGGEGHGHGHGAPYTVPDYRIYKVEDAPELVQVQKALASHGLKDPWLRNEVWRFNPKLNGTMNERIKITFFRGFKYGFGALLLTIAVTKAYDTMYPPKHGHEGGHH